MARGVWGPRIEHPDQVELEEAIAEAIARAEAKAAAEAAAEAARHTIGANGAPKDVAEPSYAELVRLLSPLYGKRWHGRAAGYLGVSERDIRRWRAGEGAPSAWIIAQARAHIMKTAVEGLVRIGMGELAAPLIAHRASILQAASQNARPIHDDLQAKAAARAKYCSENGLPMPPGWVSLRKPPILFNAENPAPRRARRPGRSGAAPARPA